MDGPGRRDFNAAVIKEFHAQGGQVGGPLADTPVMLVHHIGARSGVERVVPLAYLSLPDSRFVLIASAGGSPTHPPWYYNLRANPDVTVEVGAETLKVVAKELDPAERSMMWPVIVERVPAAGEFQGMTTRTIPVFILTRED